ncbi:MAG: hypothetical protein CL928_08695 [Deltaproteobacteria bacterium]|nr:hypothetical protein [Deltaproteobacteria bacterium]
MSIESEYLIRSIHELAVATLRLMGLRPGDENLEEVEIDIEQHLGVPISMFEQMTQPALLTFVTMSGGPEPRRTMLVGLALAARCEQAADNDDEQRVASLRPKAIELLQTATELEPPLRTPEVGEVFDALWEDHCSS